MHDPRVEQEVQTRVRIPAKELVRQQVALATVAWPARRHDVAGRMSPATRQRLHVIQRRRLEIQ